MRQLFDDNTRYNDGAVYREVGIAAEQLAEARDAGELFYDDGSFTPSYLGRDLNLWIDRSGVETKMGAVERFQRFRNHGQFGRIKRDDIAVQHVCSERPDVGGPYLQRALLPDLANVIQWGSSYSPQDVAILLGLSLEETCTMLPRRRMDPAHAHPGYLWLLWVFEERIQYDASKAARFERLIGKAMDAYRMPRSAAIRHVTEGWPTHYPAWEQKRDADTFERRLRDAIAGGASRKSAIASLAKREPELHKAWEKEAADVFDQRLHQAVANGTPRAEAIERLKSAEPDLHVAWKKHRAEGRGGDDCDATEGSDDDRTEAKAVTN